MRNFLWGIKIGIIEIIFCVQFVVGLMKLFNSIYGC
jgi:hypothetical protein